MNFTVVCVPSAEQELAAAWLAAPDRNALTRAAHVLDERLRDDPAGAGESGPGNRRVAFEAPLAVVYRVEMETRTVRILRFWRFRQSPRR